MRKKRLVGILVLLSTFNMAPAQTKLIDSLRITSKRSNTDTLYIDILNNISFHFHLVNIDSMMRYGYKALELSKKINYKRGEAHALNNLGIANFIQSKYETGMALYKKAYPIALQIKDTTRLVKLNNNMAMYYRRKGDYARVLSLRYKIFELATDSFQLAANYNNMAVLFDDLGEYDSAMSYNLRSLEIRKALTDSIGIATSYQNIGLLKIKTDDFNGSKNYYEKALEINKKINNVVGASQIYLNLSDLYIQNLELDKALKYLDKARELNEPINNNRILSLIYENIGIVFHLKNDPATALTHLKNSLKINVDIDDKYGIANINYQLAKVYLGVKAYELALKYAERSLTLAQKISAKETLNKALDLLHKIYFEIGDKTKAYEYLLLHEKYNDSLINEQKVKELAKLESKLQISHLNSENELLKKEKIINNSQLQTSKLKIQNQQMILVALGLMFILMVIVATFWFWSYNQRKNTITLLQKLNAKITDQKEKYSLQAQELHIANQKIKQINASLENKVKERTRKIELQNKKLKEYAFSNSHKVRGPLARILGLAHLYNTDGIKSNELKEVNEKIYKSAMELDRAVREVSKIL